MPASPRWHPPTLPPLDGGLPGWILDDTFVWRVASDRAGDIGTTSFWLHVPTVLELVDEILASDSPAELVHPDLSRGALCFLRELAQALPTPLRRGNRPDLAMLRCLPPFGVLSPVNPFLVALRVEAVTLADLFLNPTDAGSFALIVDRLRELLATYAAAASLVVYVRDHLADDTSPSDGTA